MVVGDLFLLPLSRKQFLLLPILRRKLLCLPFLCAFGRMVVVVVALLPRNRKRKRWVARREEKDAAFASMPSW